MAAESLSYPAHTRKILHLGLPLIGGHLSQVAIGVTDTVMLGWYGIGELAAVTIGSSFFFFFFLFGSGFAWAVMPMVATFAAEDDATSSRRATRMALWLSLGFAVAVMPLMIHAEALLQALWQTPENASRAGQYLAIAGWGIFPALWVMVLKSFLAALERTQIVFWITALAAVVNALANYALIFGNWGVPELGIAGAAIASVTTQTVMLAGVVLYTQLSLPDYALFQRFWRPDLDMIKRVLRLGLPISFTTVSEVGLFTASALMMGAIGTLQAAAHGIVMNIVSLTFMVHLGLANVATIRAGNAYGRRDAPHLAKGARTVIALSVAMAVATTLVFFITPEPLIRAFLDPGEPDLGRLLALATTLLALGGLFQLVDGAQAVALGLLRGVHDTAVPMLLAAFSYWAVGVPTAWLLAFQMGIGAPGIWAGLCVGLAVACVLLNLRFWGRVLPRL